MIGPQVEVFPGPEALAGEVADRLLARLSAVQSQGRVPQVGLTGGTIANVMYAEVSRRAPGSGVDWDRVVVWWGDERFVPRASPDRNEAQARRAMLDVLPIPPENVHPIPSSDDAASPAAGAEMYAAQLREHGASEFEVLLLGVGPDGHVASLFPGSPHLDRDDAIVLGVDGSPKPPPERITLSFAALNRAREVWFLASGPDKAWAVSTAITQSLADTSLPTADTSLPTADTSLPASRVRGRTRTTWFLDCAAAAELD